MTNRIDALLGLLKSGRDSAVLRFGLAQALITEGRHTEAIEHLNAAITQDSDYSAAWKLLGKTHMATEDWPAAQHAYEQGLRIAQANGDRQSVNEMTVFLKRIAKKLNN
jgi:predicted Zn-dependent protease